MPATPYTPTARLRADDPALPNCDAGSVPTHRALLDAYAFERLTMVNRLQWSGDFEVPPGGTNAAFTINVGAIAYTPLYDVASDTYLVLTRAAAAVNETRLEGGGTLANSTWYYVYAYSNAGVIDFEVSSTGPNSTRVHKATGGDAQALAKVYLGCFRTSSTGAPFPLRAVRGRYLYRRAYAGGFDGDPFASNGMRALSGAADAGPTALDLSPRIPPHARVAILFGSVGAETTAGARVWATLDLFSADDSGGTELAVELTAYTSAAANDIAQNGAQVEVQTTAAQAIGYAAVRSTAGGYSGTGSIWYSVDVMGWME